MASQSLIFPLRSENVLAERNFSSNSHICRSCRLGANLSSPSHIYPLWAKFFLTEPFISSLSLNRPQRLIGPLWANFVLRAKLILWESNLSSGLNWSSHFWRKSTENCRKMKWNHQHLKNDFHRAGKIKKPTLNTARLDQKRRKQKNVN